MSPRWILPPLITTATATGALLGVATQSTSLLREGAAGDVSGAGIALVTLVAAMTASLVSSIACIASWRLQRPSPAAIPYRLIVCAIAGVIAGALSIHPGTAPTAAAWLLLVGAPAWSAR